VMSIPNPYWKRTEEFFVLVYGKQNTRRNHLHQELHDLQLQYVGRLFVHYVFSQAKVEPVLFGRIEKSTVNFVLNNKHKELDFEILFVWTRRNDQYCFWV
jgi:ring-1,2-phenylacetyl-CoA epoxidase subunit PaaE